MKLNYKLVINLFIISVCAIIGVGFISGAEIVEFFARFGNFAYLGILIFFVLNFALCFKILYKKENKYFKLKMQNNSKNQYKNTIKLKNLIKSIFIFFNLLMLSSAMLAGLKILTKNLFFNNYLLVYFGCLIFILIILILGIKGLAKIDYFVIVFVFVMIAIFLTETKNNNYDIITNNLSQNNESLLKNSLLSILFSSMYVFMNVVQIEPLKRESGLKFTNKQAVYFSLAFSSFLSIILFIFVKFMLDHKYLQSYSMPLLKYFETLNGGVYIFFVIGLLLAIITTMLACLIGVKTTIKKLSETKFSFVFGRLKYNKYNVSDSNNIKRSKAGETNTKILKSEHKHIKLGLIKNIVVSIISLLLGLIFSLIGFNNFVSVIYPLIGVINFIVFVFL